LRIHRHGRKIKRFDQPSVGARCVEGKMKQSSLIEDLREVKENWHDKEYRNGFLSVFIPKMLFSVLAGFVGTVIVIFIIS
jgi:hypothetical protein